jgi:alcohol dehydrogenase class IV
MSFAAFTIARLPQIKFGCGSLSKLPDIAASYGKRLLLVTGARSFLGSAHAPRLFAALRQRACSWEIVNIVAEPAPTFIDATVSALQGEAFDAVIGIGGGSALDAAKAIAGLLKPGNSVLDHLEGVGPELPYGGPSTPLIAVPSTAGTGSEATGTQYCQFTDSSRNPFAMSNWLPNGRSSIPICSSPVRRSSSPPTAWMPSRNCLNPSSRQAATR